MILLLALAGCASPDWSVMSTNLGDGVLLSAWSDGDDVLMVGGDLGDGGGVLARYDGSRLCTRSNVTEQALWWVHGTTTGDWWAVGEAGIALHSVGGTETRVDVPTENTLFGVYDDGSTVWAVGGDPFEDIGEVWRYDGSEWTAVATDLPGVVFKVWDRWFVGAGVSYHLENDALVEHPTEERLLTVRGRDATDVWAVGGESRPIVLTNAGDGWTEHATSGLQQPLNGVWTGPDETVWVAGNFGTAAWLDESGGWTSMPPSVTSEHFHAVWQHGDEMLFVGGNLFSPGNNYGTIVRYGNGRRTFEPEPCE